MLDFQLHCPLSLSFTMLSRQLNHARSVSATPLLLFQQQPPNHVPIYSRNWNIRSFPRLRIPTVFIVGLLSLGTVMTFLTTETKFTIRINSYQHRPHPEPLDSIVNMSIIDYSRSGDNSSSSQTLPWIMGPPARKFRDNLRSDRRYITSWYSAGWSTSAHVSSHKHFLSLNFLPR
jgi:hypothetical protein